MVHERPRGIDPMLQKDCADYRLHGVGEDGGLIPASGALFAATQVNDRAQVELAGNVGQSSELTTAARSLASWPSDRSG